MMALEEKLGDPWIYQVILRRTMIPQHLFAAKCKEYLSATNSHPAEFR